jgi:hypothetical protein
MTVIVKNGFAGTLYRRNAYFAALRPYKRSFKNLRGVQLEGVQRSARWAVKFAMFTSILEISIPVAFVVMFGLPAIWQLIRFPSD